MLCPRTDRCGVRTVDCELVLVRTCPQYVPSTLSLCLSQVASTRTVDFELVFVTGCFEHDASSSLGVVDAAQRRHVLLTPLVHVHLTCCKKGNVYITCCKTKGKTFILYAANKMKRLSHMLQTKGYVYLTCCTQRETFISHTWTDN